MALWKWDVVSEYSDKRADSALARAIQEGLGEWVEPLPVGLTSKTITRSFLEKVFDNGLVTKNSSPLSAATKIKFGDLISLQIPTPKNIQLTEEHRNLNILFEDDHLLILNKPQGLTVHPSSTQTDGTLVNALLYHIKDLRQIGDSLRPGIVHRIDKNTSGAMVVTKSNDAHQALIQIFSKHEIDRTYWALCYGAPAFLEKTVETLLGRNPSDRKKMATNVKNGKKAITHFRKLEEYSARISYSFASLVEATLETGRTHQVRVHLSHIGHSVLGDPTYGIPSDTQTKWKALPSDIKILLQALPGQALHARSLGFIHPITGQNLYFEAEPPKEFMALIAGLRKYQKMQ